MLAPPDLRAAICQARKRKKPGRMTLRITVGIAVWMLVIAPNMVVS